MRGPAVPSLALRGRIAARAAMQSRPILGNWLLRPGNLPECVGKLYRQARSRSTRIRNPLNCINLPFCGMVVACLSLMRSVICTVSAGSRPVPGSRRAASG